ncbi:MAG: hypothetical protein PV340_01480 [Wolbachia sp.]|nr:hypothetical protein [Wolbachia sp.]MDD9335829.1 hypothetical protein [Wolbachia sp.]
MTFKCNQSGDYSQNLGEEKTDDYLYGNCHTSDKKSYKMKSSDLQAQNNDHLILKENIKEIKALLGNVQNELQQQNSPSDYNLTVGELVMSLLKSELS